MKLLLLGGATLLALATSEPAARATLFDFTYSGALVTFTIPTTDTYQILAFGAQGGTGDGTSSPGGLGAEIGGDFSLTAGEILQIAVGGAGGPLRGGGGGSFVVGPGNTPLVIAGGGGGGGGFGASGIEPPGGGGLTGPDGGGITGGTGGNGGGGGPGSTGSGAGGGGFFSAGGNGEGPLGGMPIGGGAFPGLAGGDDGGFGGGGGGGRGGGGGGGYSGGGGGTALAGTQAPGGGGGSFDAGIDQILIADFRTDNGEVVITELVNAIPEPSSIALLGAGLAGFAAIRRRRRHT